jgi:tartrate-resistant acid phosphatase type 5
MRRTLRTALLSACLALWAVALMVCAGHAAGPELSFVALGDWGKGTDEQRRVADALGRVAAEKNARLVISTGDNFYPRGVKSVSDPQWKTTFEDVYSAPSLMVPWWVALGNHDHRGSIDAQVAYTRISSRWQMPAAFYKHRETVSPGVEADFFFLDTTPLYDASRWPIKLWPFENKQYAWLERELRASKAAWKIVVGHHPVLSGGSHGSTEVLIHRFRPLFEKYGVDVYLNGHDHALEHVAVNGVHYFTTGAGSEGSVAAAIEGSRFVTAEAGFLAVTLDEASLHAELFNDSATPVYRTSVPRRQKTSAETPPAH